MSNGELTAYDPKLDSTITQLYNEGKLPERLHNCLVRANINTVRELIAKTPKELLAIVWFGEKSLAEVVNMLDDMGLELKQT